MRWKGIDRTDFYFDFNEKRQVPIVYSSIHFKHNDQPIYQKSTDIGTQEMASVLQVAFFPSYLNFRLDQRCAKHLTKVYRVKGYGIFLKAHGSIEHYLQTHFKPSFRTSLRRRLKGLETCFNLNYKMFHGQIGRADYNFIMDNLHSMLVRRFDQRNDKNMVLHRWEEYHANTFALINENKASLYVIYNDSKPIQISLCYHIGKVLVLSIPSYDIDYAKFGLGNISVQKLLEWCMANSYEMLDMGFGAFDYKVKWCNESYDFEHHLFYDRSSLISKILVQLIKIKTQLINFLLAKKVNVHYHRIKAIFTGNKNSDQLPYHLEKVNIDPTDLMKYKKVAPMTDGSYAFLRKSVFDFLYTHLEHVSNIQVFEVERNKSFIVKGTKKAQKIIYDIR